MESNNKKGKVVTFYSFKGGVGRSMAMVNVACILAKKNKKVLIIDWDLEAPGLHTFFKDSIKNESFGLVDFILKSIQFQQTRPQAEEAELFEFINDNIDEYITANVLSVAENKLDIITAGKFDSNYSPNLNSIRWIEFYKASPYFFKTLASALESKYDYVFIDSRTGLSDSGGICTMLMPQTLVLVFALNQQNIKGVTDIAKQAIEYRFESNDVRNLNVLPLPSRIDDNQNATDLQQWIDYYKSSFETMFKEVYRLDECSLGAYFDKAKIPYKSEHAYGEKIPVLNESISNDLFISYHYNKFTNLLADNFPCWRVLSTEEMEENKKLANAFFKTALKDISDDNFDGAIQNIEKAKEIVPTEFNLFFAWTDSLVSIAWNEAGKKMAFLYDRAFQLYEAIIELQPERHEVLHNWGTDLGNFAKTKSGKEAEELYHQAFEKYQLAIEIKPDLHEALSNWGADLGNLARTKGGKEAEELYHQAFEKYQLAIEIKPDLHEALSNWGADLGNLAKTKVGKAAEDLYHQAFKKFQLAIEIKPDKHAAFNKWGVYLGNFAKTKVEKEAEDLYKQAFEKFQKAIEIKPDKHEAYYNWGAYLGNLAKTKVGKEAEDLYKQAFEKFQWAIELKPDLHEAFNNWGYYLGNLAKTKVGKEAEDLYQQAFEKYQRTIELETDLHEAYNNWGSDLVNLAKTKEGKESEDLYQQAFEKFQLAIKKGGGSYNLSCLYALRGEKKMALNYLNISLSNNEIQDEYVEKDIDWNRFLNDRDFIEILDKYKKIRKTQ